jgi:hypothetical protein
VNQQTVNFIRAILQGMTGAGLFRKLHYPGEPEEFVDSRSLEEIRASGEFERTCKELGFPGTSSDRDTRN